MLGLTSYLKFLKTKKKAFDFSGFSCQLYMCQWTSPVANLGIISQNTEWPQLSVCYMVHCWQQFWEIEDWILSVVVETPKYDLRKTSGSLVDGQVTRFQPLLAKFQLV